MLMTRTYDYDMNYNFRKKLIITTIIEVNYDYCSIWEIHEQNLIPIPEEN